MSNIKFIYFDSENIDSSSLIQRLNQLCVSTFRVKHDIVLVNYNGVSQSLYSNLGEFIQSKNILIMEVNPSTGAYWGYMDKSLWEWLSSNNN